MHSVGVGSGRVFGCDCGGWRWRQVTGDKGPVTGDILLLLSLLLSANGKRFGVSRMRDFMIILQFSISSPHSRAKVLGQVCPSGLIEYR